MSRFPNGETKVSPKKWGKPIDKSPKRCYNQYQKGGNKLTDIERIMRSLKCSKEEAEKVLAADKAIDRGERMDFDLAPEAEKQAKKYANTGTRQTNGQKTERKRKENPTKATIIAEIAQFLAEKGYEMVEITNKERQIAFKNGENAYELTLVQKRKPKS